MAAESSWKEVPEFKVGDIVIRAYVYHSEVFGIVIDKETEKYEAGEAYEHYCDTITVAWRDGTVTRETDHYLDLISGIKW